MGSLRVSIFSDRGWIANLASGRCSSHPAPPSRYGAARVCHYPHSGSDFGVAFSKSTPRPKDSGVSRRDHRRVPAWFAVSFSLSLSLYTRSLSTIFASNLVFTPGLLDPDLSVFVVLVTFVIGQVHFRPRNPGRTQSILPAFWDGLDARRTIEGAA
jgi:hypothetical protein